MIRFHCWIGIAFVSFGCVVNGNRYERPRDLSPETLVDRPRVLGIQFEPPELLPGATANVTGLIADPSSEIEYTLWVACDGTEVS